MPVGLPHVSSTPQTCRLYISQIAQAWRDFLAYLDLPSSSVYWKSCQTAFIDAQVAASSVSSLGYLTFKPILLILWLLLQNLWNVAQFLGKHLFQQAYVSANKGAIQLKWALAKFQTWQFSLSNVQILMELFFLLTLIGLFLLRRHIEKQNYVRRLKTFYRRKKRILKENYAKGVRRVADTSFLLAMLMPHVVFLGSLASLKLFFPRLLTYLATDTWLLLVLSFWYPLLSTIGLLQTFRKEEFTKLQQQETETTRSDGYSTPTTTRRRHRSSNFFPKTTPSQSVQTWLKAATTPVLRFKHRNSNANELQVYDIQEDATYWLQYWVVYSLGIAVCRILVLMPMVGRLLTKFILLHSILRELQLVFFLWLFGVPLVTPELTRETKPLPLLYHRAVPLVQFVYNAVSNAISEGMWKTVVAKANSILDLAVMLKLLSNESQEWLIHVLQESRPVLPPALTLFMPGFLTEYGVLYVKTIVPCAKSTCAKSLQEKMAWLEYWVLHGLVAGVVSWWWPILWWIPFSTHVIFVVWCHLQIPKTTRAWYNILEEELQAFGLLERSTTSEVPTYESTRTASMLRRLASSLPSASDVNNNDDTDGNGDSGGETATTEQDGDGDTVMVEQEDAEDDEGERATETKTKARTDSQDDSSSDENIDWGNARDSNGVTDGPRRRSTRQRKQASVY